MQLHTAYGITQYTRKMGKVISLLGGLGKDMVNIGKIKRAVEDLGLNLSTSSYKESKPIIEIRKIFKDNKTLHGGYFDIFNELTEVIFPKVFLTEHPQFKTLLNSLLSNSKCFLKAEYEAKIKKDILSYITIKA